VSSRTIKKLLALRSIEESRAETELAQQRQLRQKCLDALQALQARKHLASGALHLGLAIADRSEAISAEMALTCVPLERRILQRQLVELDRSVESASAAWTNSRVRRLQIQTVFEKEATRHKREAKLHEQKLLDSWFLFSRSVRCTVPADENPQRERCAETKPDGTVRASSIKE
jgi:flagellar export protein FliJ